MVASMTTNKQRFHRLLPNGRKFSFHMDNDQMPLSGSFVHLAKTTSRSEDHLRSLVAKSLQGLKSGYSPTLCEAGVGGTYFMHDEDNRVIGVFKPHDEEMWCMNNPKGFTPKTPSFKEYNVLRGADAGEASFREYAAYLLDHDNFAGVPATGLVVCNHPTFNNGDSDVKIGSFQEFKEHDFDAEDISSAKYQQFPVHEVHKIAILDIRLLNTDRHGGNILVKANRSRANSREDVLSDGDSSEDDDGRRDDDRGDRAMMFNMEMDDDDDDDDPRRPQVRGRSLSQGSASASGAGTIEYELIPIDHGYTLPTTIGLNDLWFEWLKWPQARIPFGPEAQRYIDNLDPDTDIQILRNKFGDLIGIECFKVLRITTTWLKIASRAGLTPYTIGYALCRKGRDVPSALEKMCVEAQLLADRQLAEECVVPCTPPPSPINPLPDDAFLHLNNNFNNGNSTTTNSANPNPLKCSTDEDLSSNLMPFSLTRPEKAFFECLAAVMTRAATEMQRTQPPSPSARK